MIDVDVFLAWPEPHRARFLARCTPAQRRAVKTALLERMAGWDPLHDIGWAEWNRLIAPRWFSGPYAPHHEAFWEWVDQIGPDRPDPHLNLWPRGHAKSTAAEVACVKVGARRLRDYVLYVCATQDQADDHVGNIASILESPALAEHYPALAAKQVGKFGNSKGWRRNRIYTASGFVVDALGLDTAARGVKLEERRPDMLVLDDIDETHASAKVVAKKLRTISQDLMPAVTPNAVVILAQNFVAPGAIAVQIAEGSTDVLAGSVVSGPFPAVEGLRTELDDRGRHRIVGGTPTGEGMDLGKCEDQIQLMGLVAFEIECQQDITERPGALWGRGEGQAPIHHVEPGEVPELESVIVAVDPNKTGRGDDAGVVGMGAGYPGGYDPETGAPVGPLCVYVLEDGSGMAKPSEWRSSAARMLLRIGAAQFVVEGTGLGEHAELTLLDAPELKDFPAGVVAVQAKLGKKDRARPVAQLYKDGRVFHVGRHRYVERQMTTWDPDDDPMSPGGVDALVHGVTHLLIDVSPVPNVGWAE